MGILLIEDHAHDEASLILTLQEAIQDSNVFILKDGEIAIEYLFPKKENPQFVLPDVIFLDLEIPKIDGLTVLKTIKDDPRMRLIPVVILASSSQETDVMNAYALGANSFVIKPVIYDEFKFLLAFLGSYWVLHNQSVQW